VAPELERMTGSRIIGMCGLWEEISSRCSRKLTSSLAMAAVPNIPILIPAGGRSAVRWSRVCRKRVESRDWVLATPNVDWTVRAVMAEVPKIPWAAKTWRSAVMPAPLEGSKPAMVRATGVFAGVFTIGFPVGILGRAYSARSSVALYPGLCPGADIGRAFGV